jgi:predicted metal-dependent HD superfamily phosphohydrolase
MAAADQSRPSADGVLGGAAPSPELGARFRRSWRKLHGHDPTVIYRILTRFYGQQHRRYHTLAHVADCLREADAFQGAHPALLSAEVWQAVELALWFHDVVHQPRAGDNEERSADFFEAVAAEARFPPRFVAAVRRLILVTKIDAPSCAAEEQVIVDCDLASLGYAPDTFTRSSAAIRDEYGFLGDGDFAETRRAAFLRLGRGPSIFRTEFMQRRYERQAQENLAAALKEL